MNAESAICILLHMEPTAVVETETPIASFTRRKTGITHESRNMFRMEMWVLHS